MGIGFYKFMEDGGASGIEVYKACWHEFGIVPIIRFYIGTPGQCGPREEDTIKRIADVLGFATYFELCNEPDLPIEWPNKKQPQDWLYRSIDAYCEYAPKVLAAGGLPGTFALASGAFGQLRIDEGGNEIPPIKVNFLQLIHNKNPGIFGHGGWVSMHNYDISHPLDYPYDNVNRYGTPLTDSEYISAPPWAWAYRTMESINQERAANKNGPDTSIWTDDTCFNAYMVFQSHLEELGLTEVPLITTEGGPTMTRRDDGRYCAMHESLHPLVVADIYRRIGPIRNYFTYCHWMLYNTTGGWMTDCWLYGSHDYSRTISMMKGTPVGTWGETLDFEDVAPPGPPLPPVLHPPGPVTPPVEKPILTWLIPDWNEAEVTEVIGAPGKTVWKLTRADIAPDNMANTLWANLLDEHGQRTQATVVVQNVNGDEFVLPHKPGEPYNQPMWKNDRLTVFIVDPSVSDSIKNIHGAYWDIPGVNAFHVGYILTFQKWIVSDETESSEPPLPQPVTEDNIRKQAWNHIYPVGGIRFNPGAAFQAVARTRGYGAPVTQEFDVGGYRTQGFVLRILYAVIGDWQNIKEVAW
uniref:Glycoside hydrolase n=1 Tax=viral metagenome TaxID=1070528 RepID=A0A6M3LVA8_9ZZZZ